MIPLPLLLAPVALQALVMFADEGWCHRRRGLDRWERIGHPIDTLSVAACYAWLAFVRPSAPHALPLYLALAAFSCLLVTKDEPVHAKVCDGLESWLHALLFVLHPVVLIAFGVAWWSGDHAWMFRGQLALTLAFAAYQIVYWSIPWKRTTPSTKTSAIAGTTRTTIPLPSSAPSRGCETRGSSA